MSLRTSLALLAATAVLGTASVTAADAAPRRGYGIDRTADGYVVAESRFGNGSVAGPVRQARFGLEVRLPGGTWVACRRSCSETLRVETVDFWEGNNAAGGGAFANECGIFGCLELRWPR